MSVARSKPWAAVGLRGGEVQVIDTASGKRIARISGQGKRPQVCWIEENSPQLIVATGRALQAFRVDPQLATSEPAH